MNQGNLEPLSVFYFPSFHKNRKRAQNDLKYIQNAQKTNPNKQAERASTRGNQVQESLTLDFVNLRVLVRVDVDAERQNGVSKVAYSQVRLVVETVQHFLVSQQVITIS